MGVWKTISGTRYDAASLWVPALTYDLFSRDYAAVTLPFQWQLDSTLLNCTPTYQTWFTVYLWPPAGWADDDTFESLEFWFHLQLKVTQTGTAQGSDVRINGGADVATVALNETQTIGVNWKTATIPTTVQTLTVQARTQNGVSDSGNSVTTSHGVNDPLGSYFRAQKAA